MLRSTPKDIRLLLSLFADFLFRHGRRVSGPRIGTVAVPFVHRKSHQCFQVCQVLVTGPLNHTGQVLTLSGPYGIPKRQWAYIAAGALRKPQEVGCKV